jgi:hypothetical protein
MQHHDFIHDTDAVVQNQFFSPGPTYRLDAKFLYFYKVTLIKKDSHRFLQGDQLLQHVSLGIDHLGNCSGI